MWSSITALVQWYAEGRLYYGHAGFESARKSWSDPDMTKQADLSGRHVIVTGANSGLGFALAQELAKRKSTVHLVCRNAQRGQEARQKILDELKSMDKQTDEQCVQLHQADLSDPESIRAFAKSFQQKHDRLDVLVNNAGALFNSEKRNALGIEMSMATALGGSFLLTALLLPLLQKNAEKHAGAPGRVVNVSSGGQFLVRLDPEDPELKSLAGTSFNGMAAYSFAKRAQVELTKQWASHPAAKGVLFHSMHPGWAHTPGVTSSIQSFEQWHDNMMRNATQGADTALWLAIADEPTQKPNGGFWFDRQQISSDKRFARTASTQEERDTFWRKCETLFNVKL